MRVGLLTREYPPEVYGGAGVHVEHLSKALAERCAVEVHCFGQPRGDPLVGGTYQPWDKLDGTEAHLAALRHLSVDLAMVAGVRGVDLVHSHTWYANLAGHLAGLCYEIPHVMTTHSLEPLRPWKAEQLGGGYHLSGFCERTAIEAADAVVAVSAGMRGDVLAHYPAVDPGKVEVIHNGVDVEAYQPDPGTGVLERYGIDPDRPYVVFVGRITRQKGVPHLIDAAHHLDPAAQLVLLAGAPDTPEIGKEVAEGVAELASSRGGVLWVNRMLDRHEVVQILSHAAAFCCPSIYEPFGLVNVEAMACGAAVVASAVGGIPEVVVDGETGYLVPFERGGDVLGSPTDPEAFARDLADRLNRLVADPELAERMGQTGRERAVREFSWARIAERTLALYERLM